MHAQDYRSVRLFRYGACVFTAGYDIREEDGLGSVDSENAANRGLKNVRAIHFNDSRAVYNSRVDRHWHIGEGHIGMESAKTCGPAPETKTLCVYS